MILHPVLLVCGAGPSRQSSLPSPSPLSQPVESAASQIVHKALRFIKAEEGTPPTAGQAPAKSPASFDSQTFLDKVRLSC